MPKYSPYAQLGLWRNPFGELTWQERAELAVLDLESAVAFLSDVRQPRRAVHIQGDCGFGKTTHLLALRAAMPAAEYIYYPEEGPRPALPRQSALLLVDEAQRMGWRRRRQMLSSGGPLAIATHVDLTDALLQAGFEVLRIDAETPKSPAQLSAILQRRIDASRSTDSPLPAPQISLATAELLQRSFGSNLRRIENFLYEQVQQLVTESKSWPPAV